MLELLAEIDQVREGGLPEGWRGVIDFGEVWTEADAHLWPSVSGRLPIGEPLVYGGEIGPSSTATPMRAKVVLWAIDAPREIMRPGAHLTLRDGGIERAHGHLL